MLLELKALPGIFLYQVMRSIARSRQSKVGFSLNSVLDAAYVNATVIVFCTVRCLICRVRYNRETCEK